MVKIKLSIIIPIYNVEHYLSECLDSILIKKKYLNDFEIILVDDGSTDKSLQICHFYSKKFSFIKVIHKRNGGLSSARNIGIEAARGEWISLIDSDDIVVRNYLDIIFNLIKNTSADIIMFRYNSFIDNDVPNLSSHEFNNKKLKQIDKNTAMYNITTEKWGNYAWNKLYRSEVFKYIKYPEGRSFEDIFTTYKLLKRAKSIYIYNDILYLYRQRKNSILHIDDLNKQKKYQEDALLAVIKQIKFFKKNKYKIAEKSAKHYFMIISSNYINFIVQHELIKNSLFFISLEKIKKYSPSLKNDGIKLYLKIWVIKLNPKIYYLIKKIKG